MLSRNFTFSCGQEFMQLGGALEYQFVVASSKEMISNSKRVASSPPTEAMAASLDMRNLRGSAFM
jgi:hypothetical protein